MDGWVRDFRNAAENAVDAGFDGVELLAGDASLPEQLLLSLPQTEAVASVGDLLSALTATWSATQVGLRLGRLSAAAPALLEHAQALGLAYLHLAGPARQEWPAWRRLWAGPLLVSGMETAAESEAAIAAGHFDAAVLDRGAGL
jgi:NADH:flavin oxidoreductase / NADH oxidase family